MAADAKRGLLKFLMVGGGIIVLTLALFVTASAPTLAQTDDHKIYLPIIFVPPPPPPILFYDNFSTSKSGWQQSTSGNCMALYQDHVYGTLTKSNHVCYWPAPKGAAFTYGTFEVEAREIDIYESRSREFSYGLYFNHNSSGYYLFSVKHNKRNGNCDWKLTRYAKGSDTLLQGDCLTTGNPANRFNILQVKHAVNGTISVSLNDHLLSSYIDSQHLTGTGTGLYIEEISEDGDIIVGFDNFTVYRP